MLSESLAKARVAIEAELEQRSRLLRHEVDRIKQELGALGVLSTGPIIERVRKLCESEIEERAQAVLKHLLGTIQADGIALTPSLAKGLKDEARKHLTPEPADLVAVYQEVTRGLPGFEKKRQSFARPYSDALAKLDAEIDRQAQPPPAAQAATFAGQPGRAPEAPLVGTPPMPPKAEPGPAPAPQGAPAVPSRPPVPPGPASMPRATPSPPAPPAMPPAARPAAPPSPPRPQAPPSAAMPPAGNAETEDQKRLAEALAVLRREVSKRSWLGGFPQGEVIQLIAEAQAEVVKERPNRFRFSALGHAIAALPETPAAMQSIYAQLKEALVPLGVNLP